MSDTSNTEYATTIERPDANPSSLPNPWLMKL